jgi:hypothetical protein
MSNSLGRKVGFQDDTVTVANISESSTVAVVDIGQRQLKKIEAPTEGCLLLHLAMIAYLNSPAIKMLSKDTRYIITLNIERLFNFLSKFKKDEDLPNDCLNNYIQYQRSSKYTDYSIYSSLNIIKNGLKWCFSTSNPLSDEIKFFCRQYHIYAPRIKTPEKTPYPTLSILFAENPYNDTQILDSLKKLCIWIINYEAHFRSEVLQIDDIRQLVDGLGLRNLEECPISFASFEYNNASQHEARTLYGTIIANARESNNVRLKERLVADIRHPFQESVLTEGQLNWVLDRSVMKAKEGKPSKCRKSYFKTLGGLRAEYVVGGFRVLSIRSLLVPTDIESFAMQCLLACEKMNSSSIKNLTLEDVVETPQGIQFQFQKRRRATGDHVNITALHTLNSTIGKTYRQFVGTMNAAKDHFNASDQVKLLSYLVKTAKDGFVGGGQFGKGTNRYVELLLTENSYLRNQLLQDFAERTVELEPVFWILGKVFEQNKKAATQHAEYDRKRHGNKFLERNEFVTERSLGLTIECIRQSAIISEDSKLLNSPHLFNDLNVTAQSSNHSPPVHNTIYIDRSTAKEKIESDRLFVSRIGALMEQDANLIGKLLEDTSVLDYNQALEALGLPRADEGARERIAKRIDELGIDTDLMDSFQANGKKIFLANKASVALIIKYLEHIRANFDDVLNDDSFQLTKATLTARDYFYFSAILQKFPEEVRKEGEKYADSLPFTYAKLSDLAGISKSDRH